MVASIHVTKRGAEPPDVKTWLTDGHLPPLAQEGYRRTRLLIEEVVRTKRPPAEPYEKLLSPWEEGPCVIEFPDGPMVVNIPSSMVGEQTTESEGAT